MASLDWFVERVHYLLQAGYQTFTPSDLAQLNRKSEPDITAGLAMKIQELIDGRRLPRVTRSWSVVDNWPENLPHLSLSKQPPARKRKLPDLNFRFGGQREALYFRFEAKKLAGTGDYENLISPEDGLGRFLRKAYGRRDMAGGLLGYVHTESPIVHADRVKAALVKDPKKYRVTSRGAWTSTNFRNGPTCCFRTVHSRDRSAAIAVYYSFLLVR